MGKKKLDVMNKERGVFVEGAAKNGIDEISANKIFDEMAEFAKYAFNKSHAAAYAVVSYQTAYLKAHFPHEFMAATMNSFLGNLDKIPEYIGECKSMGIDVLKPDINESYSRFAVINKKIRFALSSIKNVGENAIDIIVKERKANGKYLNFIDFCERIANDTVNKKCIESLIRAGAFDEIEKDVTRFDLLENFESIIDSIQQSKKKNYENQISLFESAKADDTSTQFTIKKSGRNITKKEILDMEKELLGVYVSGHPLDEYMEYINKNSTVNGSDLNQNVSESEFDEININDESQIEQKENYDGKEATICGIISGSKILYTKNNKQMMFATLEDIYGSIEIVVFPIVYAKYGNLLKNDTIVKVKGKISLKENEKAKILADEISSITKSIKIYIKIPADKLEMEDVVVDSIKEIAKDNSGTTPVYLFYEGTNKVKMLNREYWLDANENLIKLLGFKFGIENVKEMEK